VAEDTDRRVNRTCARCVHGCKQRPECTVVACRQFKKKDEDPMRKLRTSHLGVHTLG
jgi:hypothetical protein